MDAIKVENVVKEFKQFRRYSGFLGAFRSLLTNKYTTNRAVDDITFSIQHGEAVGYLGPNGAGKSTMIKMLTGILVPTSGSILVKGRVPFQHRRINAQRMGVVFGQRSQLVWDLPVKDSFEINKHIYKISESEYKKNLSFCCEMLEIDKFIMKPVRQLSLGQRMRAEITLALLHEPDILFLDEPTIGLDVIAKERIRDFLRFINRERKVTIILTTHDLKDIEEICPRLLIVHQGRKIYDGTVKNLKSEYKTDSYITLEFKSDPGPLLIPGAELVMDDGKIKKYSIDKNSLSVVDVLNSLSIHQSIVDISLQDADIEEVIRSLFKKLK